MGERLVSRRRLHQGANSSPDHVLLILTARRIAASRAKTCAEPFYPSAAMRRVRMGEHLVNRASSRQVLSLSLARALPIRIAHPRAAKRIKMFAEPCCLWVMLRAARMDEQRISRGRLHLEVNLSQGHVLPIPTVRPVAVRNSRTFAGRIFP